MKRLTFITVVALLFSILILKSCDRLSAEPKVVLESIFDNYEIFTGNEGNRCDDFSVWFDLRYNDRFLAFNHPTISSDKVTNQDIINWSTTKLHEDLYLTWSENRDDAGWFLDPYGERPWGIINLDNGNQISILLTGSTYQRGDTFIVAYRRQESDALHQRYIDWFDIAYGIFVLGATHIEWYGVGEMRNGEYVLERLRSSPFD